jgi:peptide/nickel transport system ATP-binding protein
MYLGKICEVAPSDSLYTSPAHHYTACCSNSIPVPGPRRSRSTRCRRGGAAVAGAAASRLPLQHEVPAADERCRAEEPLLREVAPPALRRVPPPDLRR